MANESTKSQVTRVRGNWRGNTISIKTKWSTHDFTDDEIERLFKDEIIEFEAVSSKGTTYTARGKLEEQEYEGNKFVGFKLITDTNDVERFTGEWLGKTVRVKRVWGSHRFTDEEVRQLLDDEIITFSTVSNNTGNTYTVSGKLAEQDYEGHKYVGFTRVVVDED